MDVLVVVDMQNDFINGALGTRQAQAIVPAVAAKIKGFRGKVVLTMDTHCHNYMQTEEGKNLPVPHCVKGTDGWLLSPALHKLCNGLDTFEKPTFGSVDLAESLRDCHKQTPIQSVTLVGLCTDICVISNAILIKAFLPDTSITVDASCCAGVSPESHSRALEAMKMCHIQIVG